jgi:hypothetical protein
VIDDEAELEREMQWSRPLDTAPMDERRPPRGYTAAIGFSCIYSLIGFAIVSKFVLRTNSELGTVILGLAVSVAVVLVSIRLGFLTWRLIGPVPRTLIRPLMIFGSWPLFLLVPFALAVILAPFGKFLPAPAPAHPPPPAAAAPPPGPVFRTLGGLVQKGNVYSSCAALGSGWSPATAANLEVAGNALGNVQGENYWVHDPGKSELNIRRVSCSRPYCTVDVAVVESRGAHVVCVRTS